MRPVRFSPQSPLMEAEGTSVTDPEAAMKRNRTDEEDRVPSSASAAALRPWPDLPGLVVLSILSRLLSPADALAFSAACRPWRALSVHEFSTSKSSTYRPPLLLLPLLGPTHRRTRTRHWRHPVRCRLRSVVAGDGSYYRCMASSTALAGACLGCSHGFLLSLPSDDPRQPLLVNVFTGDELRPPAIPIPAREVYYGTLTAPPSSPRCFLVFFTSLRSTGDLLSWQPGDAGWSCHSTGISSRGLPSIDHVAAFEGKVYALNHNGHLFKIQFEPHLGLTPLLDVSRSPSLPPSLPFVPFGRQLVECRGELLMVSFGEAAMVMEARIDVFRMDFTRLEWVKVENLGDCSLFIDFGGKSPVACIEPSRWGGRRNCIYLVGPGCDNASIFPLDGSQINMTIESPLCPTNFCLPSWPSPIWVVPSLLSTSHGDSD